MSLWHGLVAGICASKCGGLKVVISFHFKMVTDQTEVYLISGQGSQALLG